MRQKSSLRRKPALIQYSDVRSVFPMGQSVRLESGRGRTTFCRPIQSSSQIARVEDVGARSHYRHINPVMSQFGHLILAPRYEF